MSIDFKVFVLCRLVLLWLLLLQSLSSVRQTTITTTTYLPTYVSTYLIYLSTNLSSIPGSGQRENKNKQKEKKMEMTSHVWFFYSFLYWGCNIYTHIPIFFFFFFFSCSFSVTSKKKGKMIAIVLSPLWQKQQNYCHLFVVCVLPSRILIKIVFVMRAASPPVINKSNFAHYIIK